MSNILFRLLLNRYNLNQNMDISFTILALVSAIFASMANIIARVLLKDIKASSVIGVYFAIMAVTMLVLSPLFYHFEYSPKSIMLLLSIVLIDIIANYFYFKTFEKSEASVATPLLSIAPLFTFILSYFILGESVDVKTLLLSLTIVFLIIWFGYVPNSKYNKETLRPAIIASFLFGLSAIPTKELLSEVDVINAPTLYMFRAALIAIIALLIFKTKTNISVKQYRLMFFRGLIVITQWVLLYYALTKGAAGVTMTISNTAPIFVFIFSIIILNEKPTLKKMLAAIAVLVLALII